MEGLIYVHHLKHGGGSNPGQTEEDQDEGLSSAGKASAERATGKRLKKRSKEAKDTYMR